ncbi:hypothetical protein [Flavisphingomonas formosensis]|uniref:hypothetical protein n=1 Tax=Flavisphingomonas formosensis TaxID=861534 RepID=UPI0012FCB9C5|nr:hypothetical protein [Sphingomonas formosensis]
MTSESGRIWVALLLPPAAWYGQQQALAGPLRLNCHLIAGWPALLWGLASLLACAFSAWLAASRSRGSGAEVGVATGMARIAMLGAGLFGLAIMFSSIAAALVPACAR